MTAVAEARLAGPWQLGERIGGGGQAVVHRARHARTGAPAAVKLFHRAVWTDPAFRLRFRRECDALAMLDHPNVVPILGSGEDDGRGWLAMGLATGGSLAERLARGPLRPERALHVLAGVAAALDAAHAAGVLHRDVTPGNILLDPAGPWLADFGIARRWDATIVTGEGQLIGTAGYIAPEVIAGRPATEASDRYGFAAVAFEVLTGRRVFEADGMAGVLYAHAHRPPPLPSQVSSLPRGVDLVMARALAKDPGERPASAGALVDGLERALGLGDPGATRVMTRVMPASRRRRPRRRRRLLGLAVVAVVALAGLGGGAVALSGVLAHHPAPAAPAPVAAAPAPLTVPTPEGDELAGSPAGYGDLPGDLRAADAVAADVADVRAVALRGAWGSLRRVRAALVDDGYVTDPLVADDGRTIGLVAHDPGLGDLTGWSPRWAMLVAADGGSSRAIVAQGYRDAPAEYAAGLARSLGAAVVPLS